jgi:hypothetical protein
MTAALVFFSLSPSLLHSLYHILNIANAKPSKNSKSPSSENRQCLWCGQSSGKLTPNGLHPKCLKQFIALPEPCRTCAFIWVDVFPETHTLCLVWMDFPEDFCEAYTPWWRKEA